MKHFRLSFWRGWPLLAILLSLSLWALAQTPGEKPIGGIRTPQGQFKPLYASDIKRDAAAATAKVDQMARQLNAVKINPEADSVEKAIPGALSLERHKADIAEVRDLYMRCKAAMQNDYNDKELRGALTAADRAHYKKCMEHCDRVLSELDSMHYNTSVMITATRKQYFLDAWDKHHKMLAALQKEMQSCPMLMPANHPQAKDQQPGQHDCCKTTTSQAVAPSASSGHVH